MNRLIFLHIPKAGGSTLLEILRRQYRKEKMYHIESRFNRTAAHTHRFEQMSAEKRNKFGLIMGHMFFGYHKLFSGDTTYITMLRDPIDRIVSGYYYILSHPNHFLHAKFKAEKISLDTYIRGDYNLQLENGMTAYISGSKPADGIPTETQLDLAIKHIDTHFAAIGILERYDESLLMYRHQLGWNELPVYFRKNTTSERAATQSISAENLGIISERNWADIALYNHVKTKFENQWNARKSAFEAEMKAFDAALDTFRTKNQWKEDLKNLIRNTYIKAVKLLRK